jgi:hypothetical protein
MFRDVDTCHPTTKETTPLMFRRIMVLVLVSLLLLVSVVAQQLPAKSSYEALIDRVKNYDRSVDFKELRLAYTETREYNPYGGDKDARKAMFSSLKTAEFDKVLAQSEKLLTANYLDVNAHFGAFAAHEKLGHAEKAAYHKYVFESLLKSISDSGDGKSLETAFVVISTDEEYSLFNYMGLKPTTQALVEDKGHHYDKMTAVSKTGDTLVYFLQR